MNNSPDYILAAAVTKSKKRSLQIEEGNYLDSSLNKATREFYRLANVSSMYNHSEHKEYATCEERRSDHEQLI